MTKTEFLRQLYKRLASLPKDELEEQLAFYGEMIDDRIEEGMSESVAVRDVGSVEKIADEIIAKTPLVKVVTSRITVNEKNRRSTWKTLLIALGSPIWLSLLISLFAVTVSLNAALFAVVVSLFAIELAIAVSAIVAIPASFVIMFLRNFSFGLATLGAALVLLGIACVGAIGCKYLWLGYVRLTRAGFVGIKKLFVKGE